MLEGWQNGYCATLEKSWGKPLAGSSPASSATKNIMFFNKKKQEPENIEDVLNAFNNLKDKVKSLELEVASLKEENKKMIQKMGIIRFNPFSDIGGDQSFSIAFLNGNNDGALITSFYSREGSSVYGKPIKNGKSSYPLSEEEKEILSRTENE